MWKKKNLGRLERESSIEGVKGVEKEKPWEG